MKHQDCLGLIALWKKHRIQFNVQPTTAYIVIRKCEVTRLYIDDWSWTTACEAITAAWHTHTPSFSEWLCFATRVNTPRTQRLVDATDVSSSRPITAILDRHVVTWPVLPGAFNEGKEADSWRLSVFPVICGHRIKVSSCKERRHEQTSSDSNHQPATFYKLIKRSHVSTYYKL